MILWLIIYFEGKYYNTLAEDCLNKIYSKYINERKHTQKKKKKKKKKTLSMLVKKIQ